MASARPALRRQIRARRRALSERQQRAAALDLARLAVTRNALRNRQRIGFYLPNDGELDVEPLMERAWSMGRHCYLPVLDTMNSCRLWFSPYAPGDRLVRNHYGIGEPAHGARRRISAARLDLILLPLVAFDGRGNRLGMGAGYYDRTLAFLMHRRHWRRPALYGVAHEFQRVDALDPEPWDVPLDGCLTERRLHVFGRPGVKPARR